MLLRRPIALAWTAATALGLCIGLYVAADTVRTTVAFWSPLPWFDDWDTVNLFRDWILGRMSLGTALFSQFHEHRLLVPRLVFFADNLVLRGQGWLALAAILLTQAVHAALFAAILARQSLRGRWAVWGLVAALMFSLRQATNFTSAFQLQFVMVFAAATCAFVLFGQVAARVRAGLPASAALAGSLLAAATSTFCMANGLLVCPVLVGLALLSRVAWVIPRNSAFPPCRDQQDGVGEPTPSCLARLPLRIVAVTALAAVGLAVLYLPGDPTVSGHAPLSDALGQPIELTLYVATYLGGFAGQTNADGAMILGLVGIAATAAAVVLVARGAVAPAVGLPLVGVMLFCGASALVTGAGRVSYGILQALEGRYATASVAFWSAELCFWWIVAPARWPRAAFAALCCWLALVTIQFQASAKPAIRSETFERDEAADLLRLGLDDPAVIMRTAWDDANVWRDVPLLRERRLSVFGGFEAGLVGRPLAGAGPAAAGACAGRIETARSDPALSSHGVRVAGTAWDTAANRRLRRVLLVDGAGIVVGLALSGIPREERDAWRGFAAAPAGSALRAYGLRWSGGLCSLGDVVTVDPA